MHTFPKKNFYLKKRIISLLGEFCHIADSSASQPELVMADPRVRNLFMVLSRARLCLDDTATTDDRHRLTEDTVIQLQS